MTDAIYRQSVEPSGRGFNQQFFEGVEEQHPRKSFNQHIFAQKTALLEPGLLRLNLSSLSPFELEYYLANDLHLQPIHVQITLPSGLVKSFTVPASYTVDQVKLYVFHRVAKDELEGHKPSECVLAVANKVTGEQTILQVEFLKFRKISKPILKDWQEGKEINLILLFKSELQEIQRYFSFYQKRPNSARTLDTEGIARNSVKLLIGQNEKRARGKSSRISRPTVRSINRRFLQKSIESRANENECSNEEELTSPRKKKRVDGNSDESSLQLDSEVSIKIIQEENEKEIDESSACDMIVEEESHTDSMVITPSNQVIQKKLEQIHSELDEQRSLKTQIEEQVFSLQKLISETRIHKNDSELSRVSSIKVEESVEEPETELIQMKQAHFEDDRDHLFRKLHEGLLRMTEVLKDAADRLERNSSTFECMNESVIRKKKKLERQDAIPQYVFKLEKIKEDFLNAEHNFVTRILKTIIEVYYDPLSALSIIEREEMEIIFANIKPFFIAQHHFYEKCVKHQHSNPKLAQILEKRMNEFQSFRFSFVRFHNHAAKKIKQLKKTNRKFRRFMRARENQPISGGLDLASLLVKPVSHIASYRLLLERYQHSLPESETQAKLFINKMLYRICNLLDKLEVQREEEENKSGLLELHQRLSMPKPVSSVVLSKLTRLFKRRNSESDLSINLLKDGRKLVKRGRVLVYDSISETKERYLVLVNDTLLVMKEGKLGNLSIVKILNLKGAEISDIHVARQKHAFIISTEQPREVCILATRAPYEKREWVSLIEDAAAGKFDLKETGVVYRQSSDSKIFVDSHDIEAN